MQKCYNCIWAEWVCWKHSNHKAAMATEVSGFDRFAFCLRSCNSNKLCSLSIRSRVDCARSHRSTYWHGAEHNRTKGCYWGGHYEAPGSQESGQGCGVLCQNCNYILSQMLRFHCLTPNSCSRAPQRTWPFIFGIIYAHISRSRSFSMRLRYSRRQRILLPIAGRINWMACTTHWISALHAIRVPISHPIRIKYGKIYTYEFFVFGPMLSEAQLKYLHLLWNCT